MLDNTVLMPLFQVLQLYRICNFAKESTVLDVILPGIAPNEYFDDRLADTLDAIFDYGIGSLEMLITAPLPCKPFMTG